LSCGFHITTGFAGHDLRNAFGSGLKLKFRVHPCRWLGYVCAWFDRGVALVTSVKLLESGVQIQGCQRLLNAGGRSCWRCGCGCNTTMRHPDLLEGLSLLSTKIMDHLKVNVGEVGVALLLL